MDLAFYAFCNMMGWLFWFVEKLVFCYFVVLVMTVFCIVIGLVGLGIVITRWIFT
jgi:hypothetical protein